MLSSGSMASGARGASTKERSEVGEEGAPGGRSSESEFAKAKKRGMMNASPEVSPLRGILLCCKGDLKSAGGRD